MYSNKKSQTEKLPVGNICVMHGSQERDET